MKSRLLDAVCACVVSLFLSTNSLAAFVLNPGPDANGNSIADLGSAPEFTDINVLFNTMNPVQIDLDNAGFLSDDITITLIDNATGIPWSALQFDIIGATLEAPFFIMPLTGITSIGPIFDVPPPGSTQVILPFDIVPETLGVADGNGLINTTASPFYSLVITPSAVPAAVPVPAAAWLFGSGLLGLVGIARRKKAA